LCSKKHNRFNEYRLAQSAVGFTFELFGTAGGIALVLRFALSDRRKTVALENARIFLTSQSEPETATRGSYLVDAFGLNSLLADTGKIDPRGILRSPVPRNHNHCGRTK
jgi:hypothetical protein